MNAILSIVLAAHLEATSPNDTCRRVDSPEVRSFGERGERIFLAYIDRKITKYEVAPLECADGVTVIIIATGDDARIGDTWTITFKRSDKTVVIRPGM